MTWRIHTGDCLRLMRDLPSHAVAAVITDPPYSSGGAMRSDRMATTGRKYTQGGTLTHRADFAGDNRDQMSYGYWSTLWLSECLRVTKPGGACLVFTDWRQLSVTINALQAGGWIWRGEKTWTGHKSLAIPFSDKDFRSCRSRANESSTLLRLIRGCIAPRGVFVVRFCAVVGSIIVVRGWRSGSVR